MTGIAVENILAYALACFFGLQAKNELKSSDRKFASFAIKKGWFKE